MRESVLKSISETILKTLSKTIPVTALLSVLIFSAVACQQQGNVSQAYPEKAAETVTETTQAGTKIPAETPAIQIREDGEYTSKDEVAAYLHEYEKLPSNFVTKKDAQKLGWEKGNLWYYCPGCSLGGSRFGNNEGLLPEAPGRQYYECDIDYQGGKRNSKRIVYSNDGLIFYSEDHYESFERLY